MPPIRVLAVDDFAPARSYVRSLLEVEEDIELVGEATNGLEAIGRASALLPDVILMDAEMPMLNGIEATKHILEEHPQISIIFFTAEEVWRRQAIEAGARLFLLKDVPPDELLSAIRPGASCPSA
jgi:DNA-binding NarL/FixJ family response regulator